MTYNQSKLHQWWVSLTFATSLLGRSFCTCAEHNLMTSGRVNGALCRRRYRFSQTGSNPPLHQTSAPCKRYSQTSSEVLIARPSHNALSNCSTFTAICSIPWPHDCDLYHFCKKTGIYLCSSAKCPIADNGFA